MSQNGYQPSFRNQIQPEKTMDLFIETLTGTAFEMTVSPFDTVMSIKSKIQRVEGIPVSHQHLLYNTLELEDASCLKDYSIEDGATLKLVLSMRGGPISTRRLPVGKEIAWKEHLRELVEGRHDDERDRMPPGARVTVFVFGEGSQMNLVRVIENDDGSYTPLSETWSGSSIRNLFAEEDPEQSNRRLQENSVTMGKMQDLQHKMETLSMQRKPKNPFLDVPSPARRMLTRKVALRHENSASGDSTELFELRNKPNLLQLPRLVSCDTLPAPCLNSPHLLHTKYTLLDGHSSLPPKRKDNRQSRRESKADPCDRRPGRGSSVLLDIKSNHCENLPNHFRDMKKPLIDTDVLIASNVTVADEKVPGSFPAEAVSLSHDRLSANGSHRYRLSQFRMESGEAPAKSADAGGWRRQVPCSMETQLGFGLDPFGHKEAAEALEVAVRSPRYGRRSLGLPTIGTQCSQDNQEAYRPTMSDTVKPEDARPDPVEGTTGDSETAATTGKKTTSVRIRCAECKKRLNITNMYTCRCGQMFCAAHRHCEAHQCTFDYKSHGRRQIQDANPVISAPKLPKI